jgi:hypothetical protein
MSEAATAEAEPEKKGKKKKEKASKAPAAGGRPKMRFKNKLMLILFSLLMMGLLRTGFVFFVIGMLPCIVAYYMDVTKHRYTFKSVFAANLSGMMPFITKIIYTGPSSSLLQEIMGDSTTWVIVYGAAFIGWLLVKVCPMMAQVMVSSAQQAQHMRYEWLQKKLESEWGDEVKQFSVVRWHEEH